MKIPKILYHGTCKAFLAYALLDNAGNLGPDYDSVSFTPDIEHATMFADSWQGQIGMNHLKKYFGEDISPELAESVLLKFEGSGLGKMGYKKDGDADEYFVEKGPVNLKNKMEVALMA
ncbi:MAG TPA: hypothetical protein QGG70_02060 [Candidatus Pacearchaeota archaeon]|jgi:hypothetical protein|nr:hypothetical protein [Candidatus Pacearchaeota archaeon]|tara:strand:+ start:652 stop:1005 length:354 start_codon:yes stop_codon:yes gene_type:complete